MGADNWAICPRCNQRAEKKKEKQREKAAESYGKVPPDEYLRLTREAEAPIDLEPSLREDYEIGITEGGTFYVSYEGSCKACQLHYDFKHESPVLSGKK